MRRLLLCASLLLALAGCNAAAKNDPVSAEPMKERLANQARAVAILEAENAKLHRELDELKKENQRLADELQKLRSAGGKAPK